MRKFSTRSILLVLLVVTSICSYIYLNTVNVDASVSGPSETEKISELEEMESNQQELVLPDIQVIKKVLETGKRLIPAS